MLALKVYALIFIFMSLVWVWYRLSKNPSVVDLCWALGLSLSGLVCLYSNPANVRTIVISLVLILWGLRLALFLWKTRISKGLIDKRYLELSAQWTIAKPLGFFLNFQLQGIFILILSLPWLFVAASNQTTLSALDWIAIVLALTAVSFETLADWQLERFKHEQPGKVCNVGLWNYSRHPNYFFEWLCWLAFSLFGFSHAYGWLSLLSPLTLYLIMTRVTGPMTEAGSIQSRGQAYLDYQKKVPFFFPIRF